MKQHFLKAACLSLTSAVLATELTMGVGYLFKSRAEKAVKASGYNVISTGTPHFGGTKINKACGEDYIAAIPFTAQTTTETKVAGVACIDRKNTKFKLI